jgi:LEA14-like dessication related protein
MLPRLTFLLLSSLTALGACSLLHPHLTRPNISVIAVEMRKGNFLQQDFAVKLHVENPNDRALPVQGLHVQLSVEGEQIASGTSDRAFIVPAQGEADFDMTVTANLALALLKLGNKLNNRAEGIDYELDGAARVSLPFMNNLPFHQSGTLSLKN